MTQTKEIRYEKVSEGTHPLWKWGLLLVIIFTIANLVHIGAIIPDENVIDKLSFTYNLLITVGFLILMIILLEDDTPYKVYWRQIK